MPATVTGVSEVVADLARLGRDLEELPDTYAAIERRYLALLGRFAPHRSGALVRSLRPVKTHGAATVTAGSTRVRYAGPINYGWPHRHIRASRFVQRADAAIEQPAVELLGQGIDKAIRKRGF